MTRALTGGLPELYTAAAVAAHIGCNERRLRKIARSLGACREIGKTMVFTDDAHNQRANAAR